MFTTEHQQALMTFPFQNLHFFSDLIHRQSDSVEFHIITPESAIQTIIGAEIGNIKRREQNKAVAVNILFDFVGCLPDQGDELVILSLKKYSNFFRRETFEFLGFGYNFPDSFGSGIFCFVQYVFNFCIVDKIFNHLNNPYHGHNALRYAG